MENQIYKILCYFCTKLNSLLMTENNFSELGRIEAIAKLYKETPYEATKNNRFHSSGKAYISHFSKVFLEGVDFDLVYFPLQHLGYKCATAVVGELYAQLASPRTLSIQLGISSKLDFNHIKTLWSGIVTAAKEHGVENVALDLNSSCNGLVISISGTGETACSLAEKRPSPASKDLICISLRRTALTTGPGWRRPSRLIRSGRRTDVCARCSSSAEIGRASCRERV